MNTRFVLVVGVVSFLVVALSSGFGQQAAAQGQGFAQNAALSFDVESIAGGPGQTVPMKIAIIGPAANLRGFVMIRGIPSRFNLSSGFLSGNAWLVSLPELGILRLAVPDDFEGRFDIDIEAVVVLGESTQRQTRSASVAIQRESQPKDRLVVLEERKQPQARVVPAIVLPERRPKDRLQPVEFAQALLQVTPAASLPAISPERETSMMNTAALFLKSDDMAAAGPAHRFPLPTSGRRAGPIRMTVQTPIGRRQDGTWRSSATRSARSAARSATCVFVTTLSAAPRHARAVWQVASRPAAIDGGSPNS